MFLRSYFVVHLLFWNKLPTKQNQFPCVSDNIYMWISRKGSGHGRKFRKCKREKSWGYFCLVSVICEAIDLRKLPLLSRFIWTSLYVALVQLVYTKLLSVTVDDTPCHIPSSSCVSYIPTSGSQLDGTAGAVGCSQEAHGLCHQQVRPWKAPLGFALYLKPCVPPVPAAPGVLLPQLCAHSVQMCCFRNWVLNGIKVRFCIWHYISVASSNVLSRAITLGCQTLLLNWILTLTTQR